MKKKIQQDIKIFLENNKNSKVKVAMPKLYSFSEVQEIVDEVKRQAVLEVIENIRVWLYMFAINRETNLDLSLLDKLDELKKEYEGK